MKKRYKVNTIYSYTRWNYNDAGVYSAGYGQNRSYAKHDAMLYTDGYFYYAKSNIAAGTAFSTAYWDGIKTVTASLKKPKFIWYPSYNSSEVIEPRVNLIQFGDGYEQRARDGINNILLKFEYSFENRTLAEAVGILHFLHTRGGTESFYFTPPGPFGVEALYKCPGFSNTPIFQNNYSIRARFEQVVV